MLKILLACGFACLIWRNSYTQDIPVGTWRNHFSFESIQRVASDGDRTFAASEFALFLFENEEITRLSKINGLIGGAITGLAYRAQDEVLLIGYEDGGIDLIKEGVLKNLSDLTNSNFGLNRSINHFLFVNDRAFAATDFGVATIDLVSEEITEVFREIGPNGSVLGIQEVLFDAGLLYAIAEEGVITGNLASNLLDFNNWSLFAETTGFNHPVIFENRVVVSRDSLLFSLDITSNRWDTLAITNLNIRDMMAADGQLFLLGENELQVSGNDSFSTIDVATLSAGSELTINQQQLWIADLEQGLIQIDAGSERSIIPSGPTSDDITQIAFIDSLFAFYADAPGSTQLDSTGFSVFSDGTWSNTMVEGFYNITDVATYDNTVYLSSNTQGIYNLTTRELASADFNETEVSIPAITGTTDGLFAIRYGHSDALYRLNEGSWESWASGVIGSSRPTGLFVSQGNVLWIINDTSRGMIAFDPVGEQSRVINQSDGLASASVQSFVIDLDDQAWIGTLSGTSFFVDATFVFDEFEAFTPFFENRVLFDEEPVTAMAVDGGDRKWMATKDGIWVFDRNVIRLEERFTTNNSPLPSNTIKDFAYDPRSGEMFILTDRGLVSYRTGSSAGSFAHSNAQIFPNPVRPQDSGPVTLRGLVQNANVRITDMQGNLIRDIDALGGTATWDLRDTSGSPAPTGIYLFFSSDRGGEETFIGKIAVIR